MRYRDQLDRSKFLSDLIKASVSFGIRKIDTPLFKAKMEQVVGNYIEELDAQTVENLIFFL